MGGTRTFLRSRALRVRGDRGAAAVEFALVLSLLVMLVFGIIEFGRAYNAKIELSGAAREGARRMAVTGSVTAAKAAALDASPTVSGVTVTVTPSTCTPGAEVKVSVSAPFTYAIPPVFSGTQTLTGVGVMRCGG